MFLNIFQKHFNYLSRKKFFINDILKDHIKNNLFFIKNQIQIKKFKRFNESYLKLIGIESFEYEDEEEEEEKEKKKRKEKKIEEDKKKKIFIPKQKNLQKEIYISDEVSIRELSNLIGIRVVEVLKLLIKLGLKPTSSYQNLSPEVVDIICSEYNYTPVRLKIEEKDEHRTSLPLDANIRSQLPRRPPVVAIMGHINHGKTSLLDAFRNSDLVKHEVGGITQKMAAFEVQISPTESITVLDTPGHKAFSAMRERGTQVVDMVILIIAGDEGIQEQTIESINQIKEAKIPMIIALNKCDKPKFDATRVKNELLQHEIIVEDFGGNVPCVEISAINKINIDQLQDIILLQAEINELCADKNGRGEAVIIESRLEIGIGFVATAITRWGTIHKGDFFVVGKTWGKIKILRNSNGIHITTAGPSSVIEIIGFRDLPEPGEDLLVVPSEERAKEIQHYRLLIHQKKISETKQDKQNSEIYKETTLKLEKLLKETQIKLKTNMTSAQINENTPVENNKKNISTSKQQLPIIIKADIFGSIEAIQKELSNFVNDEIELRIIHSSVGNISESDLKLAYTSHAIVLAFNSKLPPKLEPLVKEFSIIIYSGNVIYSIISSVENYLTSLLKPKIVIEIFGEAEIAQVFTIELKRNIKALVAGCRVIKGSINKNATIRVLRNNEIVYDNGKIHSLRHIKENITIAKQNTECGLTIFNWDQFQTGDIIQSIKINQIPRKWNEPFSVSTIYSLQK